MKSDILLKDVVTEPKPYLPEDPESGFTSAYSASINMAVMARQDP